jgi:drug/metabolite transporter (DMT)-like permease
MRTRAGLALALAAAVISGFSVYINSYGVRAFGAAYGGATAYTTAKNLIAAIVIAVALVAVSRRAPKEGLTRPRGRAQWAALAAVAVIGGSVPFVLFFQGLARASSADAAFIQKTLVIWVAVLAVPLLRERLTLWHVAAIAGLVWGQALLGGGVRGIGLGAGEAMIFAATLLWAAEAIVARRLLSGLSALTVATARMGGGVVILICYTLATTPWSALAAAGWHQWSWAVLTGLILAVYVAAWYSALARAGAIDVTALLVPGAIITALLQSGSKALAPQWPGLVLLAAGTALALLAARKAAGRKAAGPELAGVR